LLGRRLFIFALLSAPAICAESSWTWVKAESVLGTWNVELGNAEVTVKGRQFIATLFLEGSDGNPRITLKGSLSHGRLTVKEIVHDTDVGMSTFKGTRVILKVPNFADTAGTEVITLSDGFSMIGLTRNLLK